MNSLFALILAASQFAQSVGAPEPVVVYVPAGQLVALSNCVAAAVPDGVVAYCRASNQTVVMATNTRELVD